MHRAFTLLYWFGLLLALAGVALRFWFGAWRAGAGIAVAGLVLLLAARLAGRFWPLPEVGVPQKRQGDS